MADSNYNLFKLRGRVKQIKRSAAASLIDQVINDIVRRAVDGRTYWSDTLYRAIWSFPTPYQTGTVSVQTGSNTVAGDGNTNWPVSDAVNGTLPNGVNDTGYQDIEPDTASLQTITATSILVVDAGTPSQEIVPVVRFSKNEGAFTASFQFTHAPGCTITQSSLAGQQINFGYGSPYFTVTGVLSATQLAMDNNWGAPPLPVGTAYVVQKAYVQVPVGHKDFLDVVDQYQALPLKFHIPQTALNVWDPQRSSGGDPRVVADLGANLNGLISYEIWPPSPTARQISYMGYRIWPELVQDNDRPPPFIDPAVFINGAAGELLRINLGNAVQKDPWYLPRDADNYDARYAQSLSIAINADESKAIKQYSANYEALYGGANSLWALEHDADVLYQNF